MSEGHPRLGTFSERCRVFTLAFAVQAVLYKPHNPPLAPDCTKSTSVAYQELAAQLLEGTKLLKILLLVSVSPLQGALSWVPNSAADFEGL